MRGIWGTRALAAALCAGYFLVLLDVTVVNVALPQLGADLHASGAGLAWVVDAYAVPLAGLLLTSGAIGDRVGHRRVVLAGFTGFGVASVVCALAPALSVLVAGRAAQGVSAALMLPGTLALLTESVATGRGHARTVGIWAAVGGVALPAGPVLGGVLVQLAGWRSVFWLGVPLIVAAVVPVVLSSRSCGRARSGSPVDWPGAVVLVIALVCLITAVVEGRHSRALSGLLLGIAVSAVAVFWRVERTAEHPLVRVPPWARAQLGAACTVAGLMNFCVLGSLFLLTQTFQDVHRFDPMQAGLILLPGMLPLPLLGAPAGILTGRLGPWRTCALGLVISGIGFAGIAGSLHGPDYPLLICALAVWGAGLGILTPAVVTAALRATPDAPGTASGASNTARQAGGALGVAVFGAIAGISSAGAFAGRTIALLVTAGAVFLVAAALCAIALSRTESQFGRGFAR